MIEKLKEIGEKLRGNVVIVFSKVYTTAKFLAIVGILCFIMIAISIFDSNLDASGNLVTIRTVFSSIVGCLLEQTSRKALCTDTAVMFKNYCIGILAISITLLLGLTEVFEVDVNNPSIILLKNVLFSSIGFLISGTKECE
ncbi:MAG: hypothetical protein ACRDDY_01055 [Clostridium sp.]|uniref:hypothetical protein n=1 Tax=Clostridium sp. TaxID=1506 RepID=UPI003EE6C823